MKFIDFYRSIINESSGFASKETADHFISLINKHNDNKFYAIKVGDYYTIGYKKNTINEEVIEEIFKDIKHYNGVTIAPGVENTALVSIDNTVYIVNQNKQFHIRDEKGELQEVDTPKEFEDSKLQEYLTNMLKSEADGKIAA